MLLTRVIPCLLLRNNGLVKTMKFKDPVYLGDPINAVKIFNDKEVDELVFLDITATTEQKEPRFELIADIAGESFMPFAYGGGIRSFEHVQKLFKLGVEKVILNTYAAENPDFLTQCAEVYGAQSIVVSIDVKKNLFGKYEAYIRNGKQKIAHDPVSFARLVQEKGAGEIVVNNIDRDGTMKGYDLEIIRKIAEAVTIPVVACSGAGSVDDFRKAVHEAHASAVAAGAYFVFHGPHRAFLINVPNRNLIEKC